MDYTDIEWGKLYTLFYTLFSDKTTVSVQPFSPMQREKKRNGEKKQGKNRKKKGVRR